MIKRIIILFSFLASFNIFVACTSIGKSTNKNKEYPNISEHSADLKYRLAQSYFISAKSNQIINNFLDAIQEYSFALEYFPNAQIFHNLGECYLHITEFDSAITYFNKAIAFDSTFTRSYYILIDLYDNQKESLKAIELNKALLKYENTEEQKLKLAYLYQSVDINESIKIIENCILEYNRYELYLYLMDIYKFLKNDKKLQESEEQFFLLANKTPEIVNSLCEDNIKNNNLTNSLKYIDTMQLYCSDRNFNALLAEFYPFTLFRHSFDFNTVHKLIHSLKSSHLDYDFKNVYLGNLYLNLADSLSAREYYEISAGSSKNNLLFSVICNFNNYYLDYAMHLVNNNRDSLTFYSLEQHNLISSLLYENKEINYLIDVLSREYERDTSRKYILFSLANAYTYLKQIDKALKYYDLAINYFPNDPLMLNNYAYYLAISGGDLNKASKYADNSLKLQPNNPNTMDTYAWIQFLLGNYDEAYKYMIMALKLMPKSKEIYEHLALILFAKADIAGGILNLQNSFKIQSEDIIKQSEKNK